VPNFAAVGQSVAEICQFIKIFFQNGGGHPPSWICFVHVWTTYEEHLVVFVVQNLVRVDEVVSIICMFF